MLAVHAGPVRESLCARVFRSTSHERAIERFAIVPCDPLVRSSKLAR
jgi:hypothetical protein